MILIKKGLKISKLIFYTENFNETINEKVDIILSPKFYWIKKIDIPLKNISQARKIAKNIFDLEGDYIYDALKIQNKYFAIAIPKNLKLNINKKYINSIKLAQSEFYEYDCLEINEKFMLKKIDDILFCYPNDKTCPINIQEVIKKIKPTKYNLNFDTINLNKSSIILIILTFIFINLYFLSGTINYKQEMQKLEQKKESLKKYHLPLTLIQLNSIYSHLKKIDLKQQLIRKDLEFFSKTPLKPQEEYKLLALNKGIYEVIINSSQNLHNYFSKRFIIKSEDYNNTIYKAKLSHE